jgi:hypothetical protein
MVSTTWEGDTSRGWLAPPMKERASFTNAVVSTAPVPIINPRRDCSIKNPPRLHTHLEDWRPTVAHAGHIVVATVAGLRLVGGTVRSSQDARILLTQAS